MAKKEAKKTEKIEREFTVSLAKAFERSTKKRANKAIGFLRAFMKKNFRVEESSMLISAGVNQAIWHGGMEKIPRKIKVKAVLEEGKLRVSLPKEAFAEKKEKKKEAKEKTEEEKQKEKEMQKKKEEKKEMEKEAEAMAIKRGT